MTFLLRGLFYCGTLFLLVACVVTAPPRRPIEVVEMSSAYKGGVCAPTQTNAPAAALPTALPSATVTPAPVPETDINYARQASTNAVAAPIGLPSHAAVYEEAAEPVTLGALPSSSVKAETAEAAESVITPTATPQVAAVPATLTLTSSDVENPTAGIPAVVPVTAAAATAATTTQTPTGPPVTWLWPMEDFTGIMEYQGSSEVDSYQDASLKRLGVLIKGTHPIRASQAGVVSEIKKEPKGYTVKVQHQGDYYSLYQLLNSVTVAQGKTLVQGETIGTVASALEFEIWLKDTPQAPLKLLPSLTNK